MSNRMLTAALLLSVVLGLLSGAATTQLQFSASPVAQVLAFLTGMGALLGVGVPTTMTVVWAMGVCQDAAGRHRAGPCL